MDSSSFDRFTRLVATGLTRRRALRQAAGGLGAALAGFTVAEVGTSAKKKKGCGKNQQKCHGKCIGKNQCCRDADCTGGKAGACVKHTCQPAFATCSNDAGTVGFVKKAPGTAPKGAGAAMFTVGPDPAVTDWAHLRNGDYAGQEIADITTLEYSVYMELLDGGSCPDFAPYMAIYAKDGATDHILVSVPDTGSFDCEEWATIDAATGEWWMPTAPGFAPQGDPKTLVEIAAQFPGMTIRNASADAGCPNALGGLRLEAGEWPGGGGAGNAEMYVSYLKVEIGDEKGTYRF